MRASWCSWSVLSTCNQRVMALLVQITLGAYAPRQGILSTIVSLDPGVVNGYPAGISSFKCTVRHKVAGGLSQCNYNTGALSIFIGGYVRHIKPELLLLLYSCVRLCLLFLGKKKKKCLHIISELYPN